MTGYDAGTDLTLVFPPLVETGLGQIYPSTPVLAAFVARHGYTVRPVDLNARFVDHLLTEAELDASAAGGFARSTTESRAAAMWARPRVRGGALVAGDVPAAPPGHPLRGVLRHLVTPYSVDPARIPVLGASGDARLDGSYDEFFAAHLDEVVPAGWADAGTIVGISVPMGPQLLPALRLAALVAPRCGDRGRVLLGGPAVSLLDEAQLDALLADNPAVDCVVRYDGELPLLALLDQHRSGTWEPGRVGGTVSLRSGVRQAPAAVPGPKLDDLPTPAYPRDVSERYPQAWLGVLQARGCYWGKCDYCDFVEVFKGSPPYRGRTPHRVLDDIRHLVDTTGVTRFRLITESIPPAFARRFAELLVAEGVDVAWSSFIMVDRRFDADLLQLMARSGCSHMTVGLESMVSRVLALVHKSADREENLRFLRDAAEAGIRLHVNLIPDLPSTTYEEAMAGLADVASVRDCIAALEIIPFEPTQSSRVGRSPERFGLVPVELRSAGAPSGHAQLAVNALPAVDPAMTDVERTEVFARYRDLAAAINGGDDDPFAGLADWSTVVATDAGRVLVNFASGRALAL